MMPILPTSYFGSIAYYKKLAQHPLIQIEAHEHFPKQTYRNRCDILGGDGILSLSIPIKKRNGSKTTTEDIILSDEENWRIRHWRAITSAYQSSAYFDYYSVEVKELLFNETHNLLKFNTVITQRIIDWLYLDTKIELTTEFHPIMDNDLRLSLIQKDEFQEKIKAPYIQVFPGDENYQESLSILDAIFCEGPMARNLILPTKN
ncbi:MAG: WbqC family protein [Crocinitomicaceae bacterium]|nr:WbqC family protein [Crocinitomicaceae bacterium]